MKQSRSSRGFIIALVATLLWSTTGPFISYLVKAYALPSLVLAFWRNLFVSLGMILGLAIFSRVRFALDRRHWNFIILYGLTLAAFNSLWTYSVQYNGAAVATVLAFSSPAMTALLSRLVFKEEFSRVKIFSIALSFAGTILVSGAFDPSMWKLNPAGIIFGLLTGLLFAVYNLQGKTASDRNIDSWTALLYSFTLAAVFVLFFDIGNNLTFANKPPFADLLWLGNSFSGWGILIFLALVPTLGGFGLYTLSMRYLSPTTANLIATLEPVITAVWAYLFLSEILTLPQFLGGLLLIVGVTILRLGEKPHSEPMME